MLRIGKCIIRKKKNGRKNWLRKMKKLENIGKEKNKIELGKWRRYIICKVEDNFKGKSVMEIGKLTKEKGKSGTEKKGSKNCVE